MDIRITVNRNWRAYRKKLYEKSELTFAIMGSGKSGAPCDACGYCTQTDKSGKRKAVAKLLENGGKTRLKCPLYPRFTCHELNRETIKHMIELFALAEQSL